MKRIEFCAVLLMVWAYPSWAGTVFIPISRLQISDNTVRTPLRFKSTAVSTDCDPRIAGAALTVYNPASSEAICVRMPAQNWRDDIRGKPNFFVYHDPTFSLGPVSTASFGKLRSGSILRIVIPRDSGYLLRQPSQGSLGVTFTCNSGTMFEEELCGNTATGFDTIKRDSGGPTGGQFLAINGGGPTTCPPPPQMCPSN